MNAQNVNMFLASHSSMFPAEQIAVVREHLEKLPDAKMAELSALDFKNPTTALIISLLVGGFGVDRFYIGDTGLGVGKLLTAGGCGVWTIIDWFMIMGATRKKNFEKLMTVL